MRRLPAATLLLLLPAAACNSTYGVYHALALPAAVGPVADGVAMSLVEPSANAAVAFGEGKVTIASVWHDEAPAPAAVERAFVLQLELCETVRRRYPVLPPLREWAVEWVSVAADEALRERVLGAVQSR